MGKGISLFSRYTRKNSVVKGDGVPNSLPNDSVISHYRTSLVVQWIGIHLPVQGTQVQSLVQEDSHATATESSWHPSWGLGTWSKAQRFLWGCQLQSTWSQHPDDQRLISLQGSVYWWLLVTWLLHVMWFRFRTYAITELVFTLYFAMFHPH